MQGGGRGKKAGRGKGKGRGRGQQQQQQQKRQYEDMDGDVEMKHRGERGGKRYRKGRAKAMGMDDVEMQEVEVCLKIYVAMNDASTLFLPQNAALLSPAVALHTAPGYGTFASAHWFVLFGVYFWMPWSTALCRSARADCTTCACKAWSISELDVFIVHDEPKTYCCNDGAVSLVTYVGF